MSSPFRSLEEYCDSLWLDKRLSRVRGRGKWKHIQEIKKSRNRRHHRERVRKSEGGLWGQQSSKGEKHWGQLCILTSLIMRLMGHRTVTFQCQMYIWSLTLEFTPLNVCNEMTVQDLNIYAKQLDAALKCEMPLCYLQTTDCKKMDIISEEKYFLQWRSLHIPS